MQAQTDNSAAPIPRPDFGSLLDVFVRQALGHGRPVYRYGMYAGAALGYALGVGLAVYTGRSVVGLTGMVLLGIGAALLLAMGSKVLTGKEQYSFYHYLLFVFVVAGVGVSLVGMPVLPYLDLLTLVFGLAHAGGRMGCLMAGCCHGLPHAWGVRYGAVHEAAGFPAPWVGLRLYPTQLIEALGVVGLVLCNAGLLASGAPAGTALTWYLGGYAVVRYLLEYKRGDAGRWYRMGLSEAQWTSCLVLIGLGAAEWTALLPYQALHLGVGAVVVASAVLFGLRWHRSWPVRLRHPAHVAELIREVHALPVAQGEAPIGVANTSQDVQVSAGQVAGVVHYGLSARGHTMRPEEADVLAGLLCGIRHAHAQFEVVQPRQGFFHVLIYPGTVG